MRIDRELSVAVPLERAWEALLDTEDLASCVPGASLRRDGGEEVYRGGLSVPVNGSRLECSGTLRPIDADEDEREVTFQVRGRESNGPAVGHGTLRGRVGSADGSTRVGLRADLDLTGQTAEPAAVEAGARELLDGFARRLQERIVERPAEAPPSHAEEPSAPGEPEPAREGAPAPGGGLAPAIRRYGPVLGALAVLLALVALLAGRRRRGFSAELRYRW